MPEKIGLEAFVDVSKFSAGFAYYVASVDKMVSGTNSLSEAMEETAKPSVVLAQKISDLGNKVIGQTRQLDIYQQELALIAVTYGSASVQAQRKQLQIDRLSQSIQKNTGTLNAYQQELEESRQGLKSVEAEAKDTGASLSRLDVVVGTFSGTTLSGLFQSAVSGGIDLLGSLSSQALEAVKSHESLTLALETLSARELLNTGQANSMAEALENADDRAQELLKWIEQLAVESPFATEDIANTFRLAQAYGFTSDEAQRLTQVLTDFTAGTGQAGYVGERLALALGQIQAKGKVSGQELNQLREAGLNVNAVLEDMGFTLSDVEKGYVKADQFIEAIVQTLERDFEGAAARQTESWSGLISTLDDVQKIALRQFFEDTFAAIQPLAADFVALLGSDEFKASVKELGTGLADSARAAVVLANQVDWAQLAADIDLAATVAIKLGKGLKGGVDELRNSGAVGAGVFSDQSLQISYDALVATGDTVREILQYGDRLSEFYGALGAANETLLEQGDTWTLIEANVAFAAGAYEYSEEVLRRNEDAARDFQAELQGVSKEFLNLAKDAGQDRQIGGGFGRSETPVLSNADLEQRIKGLEGLNNAFEDYGDKTDDINKKISRSSQDYLEKEQDLLGELGEAQANYNNDRVEAYNEVTSELEQAESEFAEAVAEIGQQRIEADKALNDGRLEADKEFLAQSRDLETELNNAILEAGQERAAAQAELDQGRKEAEAELLRELADLEREHAEESYDINLDLSRAIEDFNRERLEAEIDFNRERGELEEEHGEKVLDITESILDAEKDSADKRLDIQQGLQDKLSDLEDKRKEKAKDIQDEINDILKGANALDASQFLKGDLAIANIYGISADDKERLAELQEQLAEEAAAFDKQAEALKSKADKALQEEEERNAKQLADLEERLTEENAAHDKALEEQKRKYDQQEADRKLSYDRAVADLQLRLARENEEFDRQRAGLQEKYNEQLGDLQASYDAAIAKLDERLASERAKYDEQKAALQIKYTEELADLQTKHDEALGKLRTRLSQEQAEYEGQRAELFANYQAELTDIENSYNERVAVVREKLQDIAVANAEKQLELRAQMDETTRDFEEKINEISDKWTGAGGAMDATKQYEDYLRQLHTYLEQTEFPVNVKLNLPEVITPGSPSPLEESLTRTADIIKGLNSTTLAFPSMSGPMMSTPVAPPPVVAGGGISQVNQFGDINVSSVGPTARDARRAAQTAGGQVEGNIFDAIMEGANRQEHNFRRNLGRRT